MQEILLNSLDILTFVVPPILPAALTANNAFAQKRLEKKGIFCLHSKHISLCGGIDICAFDKVHLPFHSFSSKIGLVFIYAALHIISWFLAQLGLVTLHYEFSQPPWVSDQGTSTSSSAQSMFKTSILVLLFYLLDGYLDRRQPRSRWSLRDSSWPIQRNGPGPSEHFCRLFFGSLHGILSYTHKAQWRTHGKSIRCQIIWGHRMGSERTIQRRSQSGLRCSHTRFSFAFQAPLWS